MLQTFIRGAAGKALTDSPALNAHSRQVLVSLAREPPPSMDKVRVAGPGPVEPGIAAAADKPAPPLPTSAEHDADLLGEDEDDTGAGAGNDSDAEEERAGDKARPAASTVEDPYSNLDALGSFGGSGTGRARQQPLEHEELLI